MNKNIKLYAMLTLIIVSASQNIHGMYRGEASGGGLLEAKPSKRPVLLDKLISQLSNTYDTTNTELIRLRSQIKEKRPSLTQEKELIELERNFIALDSRLNQLKELNLILHERNRQLDEQEWQETLPDFDGLSPQTQKSLEEQIGAYIIQGTSATVEYSKIIAKAALIIGIKTAQAIYYNAPSREQILEGAKQSVDSIVYACQKLPSISE